MGVATTFAFGLNPAAYALGRLNWSSNASSIAQLGHLPKNGPQSARAWLYGKLFVALLVEKLLAHANSVSPWGYPLQIQQKG
jgi:hypothetical protein